MSRVVLSAIATAFTVIVSPLPLAVIVVLAVPVVMLMQLLTCDMRGAWGRWLSAQQTLLAAAWPMPDDADETLMLMLMLAAAGGRR